ncbi:GAF and ANTAR domain-containing protein [Mumia qirimensis]|uniref:GAF and ANTAR domain-containing protein n=1 Tax=Mumia qirimensis TaxID=3234852 RepID=UPI00351CF1FD
MTATSSSDAFAAASAAMVHGVDAASTVHVLVADCLSLLAADTAGILVRLADNDLELLVASSHRATELELHQAHARSGPCFDAVKTGYAIHAVGDEIADRWPDFATTMYGAGFHAVHAMPLRWRSRILGGLNLFWTEPERLDEERIRTAQAFADICSLAIMQSPEASDLGAFDERLRAALEGRVVIERAKGVLSELHDLDMAESFQRLIELSEAAEEPLAETASRIVEQTYTS